MLTEQAVQDWMQYLTGLPADVGAIPLLLCATKEDLPGTHACLLLASPPLLMVTKLHCAIASTKVGALAVAAGPIHVTIQCSHYFR